MTAHRPTGWPVATAAVLAAGLLALTGCTSSGSHPQASHSAPAARSSSPAPTTSRAASTAPSDRAPTSVTILGSGDVLIHPQLRVQAHQDAHGHGYDFEPMLASIAPDVRRADLATCELETPLAKPNGPFAGYPDFAAPPQVLTALKHVGYDSCTTASNHSLDQGYDGVRRTLDDLDAAGLRHTGSARSAAEAARPLIETLPGGVRVGQLAYSFGFNGIPLPAGKPWLANETDIPTILRAAHRMKKDGADIVVVSMHWGTEYDVDATALQRSEARRLLASPDIDLILGDHAHVVQPAQRIHGKWVFYCMGNEIARHADPVPPSRRGIMPLVTFTRTSGHHFRTSAATAIPTWMQFRPALRLIDIPRALASGAATPAQRRTYLAARRATVTELGRYGALNQGLTVR